MTVRDRACFLIVGEDSYTAGDGFAGIAERRIDLADVAPIEP